MRRGAPPWRGAGVILDAVIERMRRPSIPLSILLVVGGVIGLVAAFALTLDKFIALQNTIDGISAKASCDYSVLVQCTKNLNAPEGSVFGFPNPLLGLMMFPAPIVVGVASLAGVRFPRWFWALFNVGMAFAIGFVAWLMTQSLFDLRTLCPWCMVVWSVVIPMSLGVTLYNVREGNLPLGQRASRVAGAAFGWLTIITLVVYVVFVVLAQVELNALNRIF